MKKILLPLLTACLLLSMVGCGNSSSDSSTPDSTSASTEKTSSQQSLDDDNSNIEMFDCLRFRVPASWGTAAVDNLAMWYPIDSSGALIVQDFTENGFDLDLSNESGSRRKIADNLTTGYTIISEVERTMQNGIPAFAVTYTSEDDPATAIRVNVTLVFIANGKPFAMTFSNYTAGGDTLTYLDAVVASLEVVS